MKFSIIVYISSLLTYILQTRAYDIRCIWPEKFTTNLFEALHHDGFFGEFMTANKVETPVVIRLTQHGTMCRAMCLSLHDPHVLDPYKKQPTWTVPEFGQNGYSTVMCIGQCMLYTSEPLMDYNERALEHFKEEFGLEYERSSSRPDIELAWSKYRENGGEQSMIDIMEAEDYHPITMGHIAGYYVKYYEDMDGWNHLGQLNWDRKTQQAVPCTGDCRAYQDIVGYEPVIDPRIHSSVNQDATEYNCTGNCRKWQPLQEGNDAGSLKRQEFITPHIGETAMTFLRPSTLTLEDPMYDLYHDSLQVIEEVKMTHNDTYRKDAVEYFDDKLLVRGLIRNKVRRKFARNMGLHSFQDDLINLIGIATAEYDALIQAWHEKWAHDLVRPTTVIKNWGSDVVLQDRMGNDVQARDFEAAIRVMPHPEFPSGSSCLCTSYIEYTNILTMEWYNETLRNIKWRQYYVDDLEELRDVCGASRIWGGMHYPAAIEAGNQVCSGLGQLAYEYTMELKNNATFENAHYWGDELGECPEVED